METPPGISGPRRSACLRSLGRAPPHSGLSLGWLVIVQSPDEKRVGSLIPLAAPRSVLSRGVRNAAPDEEWFDFADEFMSAGHAM